ncbi:5-formyltetrahydrofolate cyclo-ligase [Weissella viridescens]|uniref:5-formyltetrahydrofolate cyclo-ligase n=1 Tax=Weissella viridescens TaxID=1629 RepID=A0A380NXT0_WEIVI|nr:5-formyltetrahydrofolate cyclo-ligase [Weissella viridescens]
MIDKSNSRSQALSHLAELSDQQRVWYLQKLVQQVTALTEWQNAKVVALTMAQDEELPTELLIQTALLQGKKYFYQKCVQIIKWISFKLTKKRIMPDINSGC